MTKRTTSSLAFILVFSFVEFLYDRWIRRQLTSFRVLDRSTYQPIFFKFSAEATQSRGKDESLKFCTETAGLDYIYETSRHSLFSGIILTPSRFGEYGSKTHRDSGIAFLFSIALLHYKMISEMKLYTNCISTYLSRSRR
ncbi:unnamed protein product [Albugo candida]|uniref:Uncharacterized protein n=1 Tax=Albugo candida TaxID=65357 RepID=A0A024GDN0_9STRA|nr:unnamed protein product [Albugo candida]|eukprot:CCI44868.1 unnamed protein product [Albugo candida]